MKVYLRTPGHIPAQAKCYAAAFNGRVLKQTVKDDADIIAGAQITRDGHNYAYVETETGDRLMMAPYSPKMPARGYGLDTVLTYRDDEAFHAAAARISAMAEFKVDYPVTTYPWNTLIKFYDTWGYGWILELPLQK